MESSVVTAVAWVCSLAQELPSARGTAKKIKFFFKIECPAVRGKQRGPETQLTTFVVETILFLFFVLHQNVLFP